MAVRISGVGAHRRRILYRSESCMVCVMFVKVSLCAMYNNMARLRSQYLF